MASVLTKDKKGSDFVLVPRKEYKKLLDLEKTFKSKLGEIKNTDSAIKIYLKEKKLNKLEDFLFVSDKKFISKMNKARQDHKRGRTQDWESLKKELNV